MDKKLKKLIVYLNIYYLFIKIMSLNLFFFSVLDSSEHDQETELING